MSNIKSLILGSAASLVAFAGAQAADLPVKAKAVQYVKICSLYGAGFYYIPGTETCLKIGGYVAAEMSIGDARGSHTQKYSGADALNTRDADNIFTRARTNVTFDTRTATEYGVLRTFYQHDIHFSNSSTPYNSAVNSSTWGGTVIGTAFVQFAGFTFGKALGALAPQFAMPKNTSSFSGFSDATAPNIGIVQALYTADLGNGLSISLGLEESSYYRQPIYDTNLAIQSPFVSTPAWGSNSLGGQITPDFVANIKFDQAWGGLFAGVKVRDLNMTNYAGSTVTGLVFGSSLGATGTGFIAGNVQEINGHANDTVAFGVVGGFQLKALPTGVGDTFTVLASYGDGITSVSTNSDPMSPLIGIRNGGVGGTVGYGAILDAVTVSGVSLQKTKSYGVQAGFEHYWVPGKLRTSLYGSYTSIDYNSTANALLCAAAIRPTSTGGQGLNLGGGSLANTNCNFDVRISQVGSRSAWTPVAGLEFQAEVLYSYFDLPLTGTINAPGATGGLTGGTGVYTLKSQDSITGQLRVIRTF